MHPNALLDLTTELLRAVLRLDQPADSVVSAFFRQHRKLGPRERHTLAETTYAVLRRKPLFEHLAALGGDKKPNALKVPLMRRLAILGWQGNDAFLRAALTPDELAWLARAQAVKPDNLPAALRHLLPEWLAEALQAALDREFWPLAAALDQPAPMDLRVNALKMKRDDAQRQLADAGIAAEPTPYSPWGLRVQGKPALTQLPLFQEGSIEVQDEGSQLLALLTDAHRGEMVVDFCAGAGGKTLALGASMRNTGRLYAFDVSGHRLAALKPRLARSGLSNVYPAQIAHERDDRVKRLAGKIQRVLVDAPCSGLGTIRRNPDLKWRQSPADVAELQQRQQAILASAARLVAPGGRLVYATCSLLRAENEDVADAFEAAHGREFDRLPAAELLAKAHVEAADTLVDGDALRLWPHRHGTDGFFAMAWQRR
ncbi:MAG: RsmB/NOP family class I SAM-dependent RNA methyltransferase [Burkholderiaceae bacterium]|nr:RsmB/NOP family class I SAM-dependent RNA methyltransferase [Rhodoferax sp.]MCP5284185.1 RsmB/NOP family class I SAM-dependent RNA methyltransferase [Burkholderiaceae bacterium]